jgi:CRP/FNR family transcriptional regulator
LTETELEQVSHRVVIKEFGKNEVILREKDTNEFMYIILLGKVKVVQVTEDGKEIILALHRADDFFGEVSLVDGKTFPATVVAMEESLIALIAKKDFYSMLYSQVKVLERLLQILCERLRESWNRIHLLNFNNAAQRVKMLLLSLSYNHSERTPEGVLLTLKLTHQDIADMAGLTRETVTRVIDKLQKDGEITIMQKKSIRLNSRFLMQA